VPDLGGIFLEKDNFAPANPLQTPPDIVPLWYFTPFYSILRASTESLLFFFAIGSGVIGLAAIALTKFNIKIKAAIAVLSVAFIFIFLNSSGKAWGVILMGSSIVMLFLLPWLDRSPVLSIRYRSMPFKIALTTFLIAFFVLGYLGMNSPTPLRTLTAQVCTVIYFAFFILMPWFTSIGQTKPVPDRVTTKQH